MDKIFLQELAEGMAERKGMPKKDAEAFIRTVFEIIEEYLLADQVVKVKGLGTFKLVTVDSRESINVNTGERITINSHGKVTFTPDKTLSDHLNRPFADFATVVLNDKTRTEDMEQMETIAPESPTVEPETPVEEPTAPIVEPEVPAEEPAAPITEPEVAVEEPIVPTESPVVPIEETAQKEDKGIANDTIAEEDEPVEHITGNIQPVMDNVETSSDIVEEEVPATDNPDAKAPTSGTVVEQVQKSNRRVLWLLLLLVAILLLWWWLDRVSMSGDTTSTPPAVEQKDSAHIAAPATTATSTQTPDSAAATQEVDTTAHVAATNNAVAEVPTDNRSIEQRIAEHPQIENGEWWMVGTKTVHTLQQGEDLSKLALHYYGDKRLISYIMRYNHMTPAQASRLFVGAKVEIPELVKRN